MASNIEAMRRIGDRLRSGEIQFHGLGMRRRNTAMALAAAKDAGLTGEQPEGMKKGGKVKKMAKGGSTTSKRADGCATKGKTKGRFV